MLWEFARKKCGVNDFYSLDIKFNHARLRGHGMRFNATGQQVLFLKHFPGTHEPALIIFFQKPLEATLHTIDTATTHAWHSTHSTRVRRLDMMTLKFMTVVCRGESVPLLDAFIQLALFTAECHFLSDNVRVGVCEAVLLAAYIASRI